MPSHTSLKENIGTVQGKAEVCEFCFLIWKVLSVVDIPGHEKIRYESLEKYKSNTRGFVFVVDSKNIQTELKDVAEFVAIIYLNNLKTGLFRFLYNILTDPRVSHSGNRILIACNKQDSSSAKGCSVVRSLLEKELNTLTITRIGALAGLEQGTNVKPVTLTKPGINFTFASSRLPVDFVECSAVSDISPIKEWLHRI
ncbi:Signal recognition particle receptor B subunit 159 [Fasciola hepatica]|uniref:Signal recognition particle receptor subunit beta n=1 Tax=Fasciola hepatica TaxID=6192 RepID=A0A4E0R3J7_FASHE|nr:Signal recognition particle receptor B subunit 159 [Fasciola hepatica]